MKLNLALLVIFLFCFGTIKSQNQQDEPTEAEVVEDSITASEANHPTYAGYSNNATVAPEQKKRLRNGFNKFPDKPKDAWELGIHGGVYFIDGDVDQSSLLPGFGLGLHLRKAIHYTFSLRFDMFYGQTYGINPQITMHKSQGGCLVEPVFDMYEGQNGWYASYKTDYVYAGLKGVLNIGNILFNKERNKWNWTAFAGFALSSNQTMLDLTNGNVSPYDGNVIRSLGHDTNTRKGRLEQKKAVKQYYDGKYETKAYPKYGIFRVNDKYHIHPNLIVGMGIYRKINKRINIGLEHQAMISDNDYLDGIRYRTSVDMTNQSDMNHYTNLRLAINLTNFEKRTEPLYWLNPLDKAFSDIAQLKQRPVFDLTDSDGDGVIDLLDIEPNTPPGCPVDARGVMLDSDGDGIPDCFDHEPFSHPGFPVDEFGVAVIPDSVRCCTSKEEIKEIIRETLSPDSDEVVYHRGALNDWFLPMIHFDLDKFYLKPQYYGHLKHIADMMEKYHDICVTAFGATDNRASSAYNDMLSYNRSKTAIDFLVQQHGIERDRLRLMYGGKDKPLVPNLPDTRSVSREEEMGHYINRRVEFRVCKDSDYNMERPAGVIEAGSNTPYSPGPGNRLLGDKTIGF